MIISYSVCAKDYESFTGRNSGGIFSATWVNSVSFYGPLSENKLTPKISDLHFYGKTKGSALVNLNTPMRAFFNKQSISVFSAFI